MLARRIVSGMERVVAGYGDAFVMTVRTTAPNETFTWPGRDQATDALFDWGDGTSDNITAYDQAELVHTYTTAGDYDIQVTGTCGAPLFNDSGDKLKVVSVKNLGALVGANDYNSAFYGCENLASFTSGSCDTASVESFNSFLRSCVSLSDLDVSTLDTGSVSNAAYMFDSISHPDVVIDLTGFDTSLVEVMGGMFRKVEGTVIGLENLDTSACSNMNLMFYAYRGTEADLSGWCVSLIPTVPSNFNTASTITSLPVWGTCP